MKEKGHYRSIIGCCLEDGSFHFTAFRFLPNEIICKAYVSRVHLAKIRNQSLNAVQQCWSEHTENISVVHVLSVKVQRHILTHLKKIILFPNQLMSRFCWYTCVHWWGQPITYTESVLLTQQNLEQMDFVVVSGCGYLDQQQCGGHHFQQTSRRRLMSAPLSLSPHLCKWIGHYYLEPHWWTLSQRKSRTQADRRVGTVMEPGENWVETGRHLSRHLSVSATSLTATSLTPLAPPPLSQLWMPPSSTACRPAILCTFGYKLFQSMGKMQIHIVL